MNNQPVKVLYVDDNILDRELVRDALEQADYPAELLECSTREEFELALEGPAADVVLTDFNILGYEGLQVLKRVHERWPGIPVIVVTGTGSEEVAARAMKAGAADYIIKTPRSMARIHHAIAGALESVSLREERRLAEQSLRESEARFRRAVENAPVPMMIHVEDGEITALSRSWERITGYSRMEIPTVQDWLRRAYGGRWQRIDDSIRHVYDGTEPLREGEFELVCKDGSRRIWEISSTPLGPLPDDRRCAVTIASDVTQRKLLESRLRHAQKMEALGRLAGGVAHDFNNMLQVITGFAQMAVSQLPTGKEPPTHLQMILEAAERAAGLTRQLLTFSRNEAARPTAIDPSPALAAMSRMLERIVGEDVSLELEVAPDAWQVRMDPAQLDSLLANLVVNARDAIADHGRIAILAQNVSISPDEAAEFGMQAMDYLRIKVEDTGMGMDEETLDHVFEPFFTTKAQEAGTGLGLATVYGIVTQNGGHVRVESRLGVGTTFHVYLPRYQGRGPTGEAAAEPGQPTRRGATVLLVEDEPAVLRITAQMLSELGYRVIEADRPSVALEHAASDDTIGLVVTDVIMPEMDGPTLSRRLREIVPGLAVIFTSGYPAQTIGSRGILDGDVHLLPKPFDRDELAQVISEALEGGVDCPSGPEQAPDDH